MNLAFNNRLQAATDVVVKGSDTVINKEYSYLPTGEIAFSDDKRNVGAGSILDSNQFDRLFTYDRLGRVLQSRTGAEAHGSTDAADKIPYAENFSYNAFGNKTAILGTVWGAQNDVLDLPTWVNNRSTNIGYDAEGHQMNGQLDYVYDSSGQQSYSEGETVSNASAFDGDGQELKRIRKTRADDQSAWTTPKVAYFITSSALGGQIVNEAKSNGAKDKGYVYGEGALVAKQIYNGSSEQVDWEHTDASGQTIKYTSNNGNGPVSEAAEMNATGNNVGTYKPLVFNPVPKDGLSPFDRPTAFNLMGSGGCDVDGLEQDCSWTTSDSARQCPNNNCSAKRIDGAWVVWGYTTIKDPVKKDPVKTQPTLKED